MNITWIGSPYYDENRNKIDRIVIHWFGGKNSTLKTTDSWFKSNPKNVSAHYGVEDNEVHRYVKDEHVSYGAGNYAMNQRCINIELSANPDRAASEGTYRTVGELVLTLSKRFGIPIDREHILKHKEVVATQCPGTIDIDKILEIANNKTPMATDESQANKTFVDALRKEHPTWYEAQDFFKYDNERSAYIQRLEKAVDEKDALLKEERNKPPVIKEVTVEKPVEVIKEVVKEVKVEVEKKVSSQFIRGVIGLLYAIDESWQKRRGNT